VLGAARWVDFSGHLRNSSRNPSAVVPNGVRLYSTATGEVFGPSRLINPVILKLMQALSDHLFAGPANHAGAGVMRDRKRGTKRFP